jgi:hypothetical protein
MKSQDERADNLVSRLFAYAPRAGRQALEDYCTEALAWCLRKSPTLLQNFLNLTKVPALRDWPERAEVHTQMRYDGSDADDSDDDGSAGRFDLVIESGVAAPFVLVVESKVGSGFGHGQLENYRTRLKQSDAFPNVPEASRYLVTLTTLPYKSNQTDGSITWPEVQKVIAHGPAVNDTLISGAFEQFASFLQDRGLAMLKLNKTDKKLLDRWFEVKELEEQLKQIVERLRNQDEPKPVVGRRQVKVEKEWIGVYGKNRFYAGFGITQTESGPEFYMWVEITIPGDRRNWTKNFEGERKAAFTEGTHYLKINEDTDAVNFDNLSDSSSRFVFGKGITGALDGNGEAVFQWLYDMSKLAFELAKRAVAKR